jgi:hypothetical protein
MVLSVGEGKTAPFQHVGADQQGRRCCMNQNHNRNSTIEGTIEARTVVMLKAKALEVSDRELERFEESLEKLMQGMDRVRNEIRKTKLMIVIGFTPLIAFQILLRWIRF